MNITFDTAVFTNLLNTPDALSAAWVLIKAGAWMPILVVIIKGISWAWLDERQDIFASAQKRVFLAVDVPKNNEQLPKAVENIFSHLQGAYSTPTKKEKWFDGKIGPVFSFEIISIGGYIQFVITTWEKYRDVVEALIYAQYPDAEITEIEDYVQYAPQKWPDPNYLLFGTEFQPKKSPFYPIKTYPEFEDKIVGEFKDPMAGLLESMSKALPEEQIWLQILVQLDNQDWVKGGEKLIKKLIGAKMPKEKETFLQKFFILPFHVLDEALIGLFGMAPHSASEKKDDGARSQMLFLSPGEKNVVEAVERKITKIVHSTKIRFVYFAPRSIARTSAVIAFVRGALIQFTQHDLNALAFNGLVTTKRDYFWQQNSFWYYASMTFYRTVNERMRLNFRGYKNRSMSTGGSPFKFNTEELASIWHFPIMTVKAPAVKKTEAKRSEGPAGLPSRDGIPGLMIKKGMGVQKNEPAPAVEEPGGIPFV